MKMAAVVRKLFFFGLATVCVAQFALNADTANAQTKGQISDKTVVFLSKLAFQNMTRTAKDADGKVVKFSNKDLENSVIPRDEARKIIRIAYRSAKAQNCGLIDYQAANYKTLIRLEKAKNKWTPAQRLFISKLHLAVVQLQTGHTEVAEARKQNNADKTKQRLAANKKINEAAKKNFAACTPEIKAQLKKEIENYVKTAQKK